VILVMGKGGVGKTTVAASLASLEAETNGCAVLTELGDGDAGRRTLSGAHPGVEHVVIRDDEALQRAAAPLFGSATLARLVLGNFAIKPLVRAAPAIRELAMLEAVRQVAADRPGVRVVVDMPATGHSIAWLRVPGQGRDFLGSGRLFELCDRLGTELVSPGRVSIVVVTLPERLVIEETVELCAALDVETGLDVARIVVNRMPVPLPAAALDDARRYAGSCARELLPLTEILAARRGSSTEAEDAVALLARRCHGVWRLPLAPDEPSVRTVAGWLRAQGAG